MSKENCTLFGRVFNLFVVQDEGRWGGENVRSECGGAGPPPTRLSGGPLSLTAVTRITETELRRACDRPEHGEMVNHVRRNEPDSDDYEQVAPAPRRHQRGGNQHQDAEAEVMNPVAECELSNPDRLPLCMQTEAEPQETRHRLDPHCRHQAQQNRLPQAQAA